MIPLLYGKPTDKAIITPKLQLKKEFRNLTIRYPVSCIVTFHPEILELARKMYRAKLIEEIWKGWPIYEICLNRKRIGITSIFQGSGGAGMCFEILIARKIKNFIFLGSAGGLADFLKFGDIVLITKAIRDEGVSYHYSEPSTYSYPRKNLNKKIEKVCSELGIKFHKGISWTIDAPFRITHKKVKLFKREGVICCEQEAAALFSIANFRKVKVSCLAYISDRVSSFKWEYPLPRGFERGSKEKLVEIALRSFL